MDNFADERDFLLLDKDKYTFFILRLVIGGDCKLLLTDHEKLIICYSCPPYPITLQMKKWSARIRLSKRTHCSTESTASI